MAFKNHIVFLFAAVVILDICNGQGLQVGYYSKTCPMVEEIVKKTTNIIFGRAPSLTGPLLRMHFHDCFVRGCDASILLNSTTAQAEKNAPPNLSVRGYGSIDRVKSAVEAKCPGVVSCADILALVARDATTFTGGLSWEVPLGRRDGNASTIPEALANLPPFSGNISLLIGMFAAKGLNRKDLAVLSGGHTIGTSHCSSFTGRLYNFSGTGGADPALDSEYVPHLRSKCSATDQTTLAEMDPGSVRTFDENYFSLVAKRRGLFQSDAALLDDSVTSTYVRQHAIAAQRAQFFKDFGESMVKMGNVEVLTGNAGEIRKHCAFVN